MNTREEEYILAIETSGSIKAAADKLLISPPGLCMFLSGLEQRLGVHLFHRVGKKLIPTDIGMEYIRCAKQISDCKRVFDLELSDYRNEITGTVAVGMHPRRTTYMLPRAARILNDRYPKVKLRVFEGSSDELFENVISGNLDFSINNRPHEDPALELQELYKDRLVAVIAANDPRIAAAVSVPGEKLAWIDISLFKDSRFILQHPSQSSRVYTDAALRYAGVTPDNIQIIENLETASQMAAESLGIAFNLYSFTKNFTYDKPVRYFLIGDRNYYITYNIAKRKDRLLSSAALFFIDALKTAVAEN